MIAEVILYDGKLNKAQVNRISRICRPTWLKLGLIIQEPAKTQQLINCPALVRDVAV